MRDIQPLIQPILDHFGLSFEEIKSKTRDREIAYCRFICIYKVRVRTNMASKRIGALFGGRDHSTVLHACQRAEEIMEEPGNLFLHAYMQS